MATILFVDDDEMERYFAREVLEPRGHRVLYASDGETALRVFDNEDVDVVVTDLAMPRLNGLRLIQQLRERDRHVPIIAASGINADQLDMAEDFGALAVLQKPWDPRRFLETLSRITEQKAEKGNPFEAVWPTAGNEMEIDEEGRLVRTGSAPDQDGTDDAEAGEEGRQDEPTYDLGLTDLDLEVEEVEEEDVPAFDLEIGELELEDPDER